MGYWLWALKDPETVKYSGEGVILSPNGKLHWMRNTWNEALKEPLLGAAAASTSDEEETQSFLGKEIDVPDDLVEAAESVAATSLVWWRDTYAALAAELGVPGGELARLVAGACALPSSEDPIACSRPSSEDSQAQVTHTNGKAETSDGWRSYGALWVQHPVIELSSVLAGCYPQPFATFTSCGRMLFDARGTAADGLHAVAVCASGEPLILHPGDDVIAWSAQVPSGSAVLIAVVNLELSAASHILNTM